MMALNFNFYRHWLEAGYVLQCTDGNNKCGQYVIIVLFLSLAPSEAFIVLFQPDLVAVYVYCKRIGRLC